MKKKGVSNVIILVLIIFLSITGFVLVWLFVKDFYSNYAKKISDESLLLQIEFSIIENSVRITDSQDLDFVLQLDRAPEGVNAFPIIVLEDSSKSQYSSQNYKNSNMKTYERINAIITKNEHNLNDIKKIKIYSAFMNSEGNIIVAKAPCDIYEIKEDDFFVQMSENQLTLTLSISPPQAGQIVDENNRPYEEVSNYPSGTSLTLIALPNDGYSFLNWFNEDEEVIITTEPEIEITLTGNAKLTAQFVSYQYQTQENLIYSCKILNESGKYILNHSIEGINGTCFLISSDNIFLDGAGNTISQNYCNCSLEYYGVAAQNVSNITIFNLTIKNFGIGINLLNVNNSNISKNLILNSTIQGVFLRESNHNLLFSNIISNTIGNGIFLLSGSYNNLTENKIGFNMQNGIKISDFNASGISPSINNDFRFNLLMNNSLDGILLSGTHAISNIIYGNIVYFNGGAGINVSRSCSNKYRINQVCLNSFNDFACEDNFECNIPNMDLGENNADILSPSCNWIEVDSCETIPISGLPQFPFF